MTSLNVDANLTQVREALCLSVHALDSAARTGHIGHVRTADILALKALITAIDNTKED